MRFNVVPVICKMDGKWYLVVPRVYAAPFDMWHDATTDRIRLRDVMTHQDYA